MLFRSYAISTSGEVWPMRVFLLAVCCDGAEVAHLTLAGTQCPCCEVTKKDLARTDLRTDLRSGPRILEAIKEGRRRYYKLLPNRSYMQIRGMVGGMIYTLLHMFTHVYTCFAGKAKEFEDKLKHPLFPDNAFLNTIPEFVFA